jgi:hypothetical protein
MQTMYGFEGKAFIISQLKQRECLETATALDWSKLDLARVEQAVGKVINHRPGSYSHPDGVLSDQEFRIQIEQYWGSQTDWYIAPELPASFCSGTSREPLAEEELC